MKNLKKFGEMLLEKGEPIVIAQVVDTQGSTPRKKGACLIMRKDGQCMGTVGGGKLEAEVEKCCRDTFVSKQGKIYEFKLKPKELEGLDMRCGGDAQVKVDYISPESKENFILEVGDTPKAFIFGAGHVAKALAPVLHYVDFDITVLDDRKEFANKENFPHAEETIILKSFEDVYKQIQVDEKSFIVIVTRGHSGDYDILKQTLLLPQRPKYIGMIGSKTKVAHCMERLSQEGFSKEQMKGIYSPVGMSICAETPEEIAISIAGEMIFVRREAFRK